MENNKKILMIGIIAGIVIFSFLVSLSRLVFQKSHKPTSTNSTNSNQLQPTATPTLIPHPVLGSMTIQNKTGTKRLLNDKEFSVIISATSEGENIVGYDAILSFDKNAFTYVKTTSLLPEFKVFSY